MNAPLRGYGPGGGCARDIVLEAGLPEWSDEDEVRACTQVLGVGLRSWEQARHGI